jgi:hypothetical protein
MLAALSIVFLEGFAEALKVRVQSQRRDRWYGGWPPQMAIARSADPRFLVNSRGPGRLLPRTMITVIFQAA